MVPCLAFFFLAPASAGLVEAWSYERFPRGDAIAGEDGWVGGYDGDPWATLENDGDSWAYSLVDHAPFGEFGSGGPYDNWLVHEGEAVRQGVHRAVVYPTDNDAFGVVFGWERDHYYLLLVCGEEGNDTSNQSCPVPNLPMHVTALVEVTGSRATVLDSVEIGATLRSESEITVSMDDGALVARIGRTELNAEVGEDFMLNGVGFYAFNEGLYSESGESDGNTVYFRSPALAWQDEDDDEIVDDQDNCEAVANADQADLDGDGIGSACDDEEAPPDPVDDTGVTEDTDPGGGPPGDAGADGGGGETIKISPSGCGCDSGAGAWSGGWVAVGLLGVLRRRRRGSAGS